MKPMDYTPTPSKEEDHDVTIQVHFAAAGISAEEHLVLSNDVETVKKGCGKSFVPFPKDSLWSQRLLEAL
ncbi:stem-specific protein TSJT1-like protein [Tanacetum coccineum]